MSLDMIDAIFIARRGVLRCSANSLGCAVCSCAATTAQRPTNTDAERPTTESVCLRAAPKNSPLMGPLYAFHNSHDKSRLDGCETNDRRGNAGVREIQINL